MERGSDKHGPRQDEALAAEVAGMMRAERAIRAEDWKNPEPSGEDQPDVDLAPDGTLAGGLPPGMDESDIDGRTELATYLGREVYPADRAGLIERANSTHAPDRVLDRLRELPEGREFGNLQEVWVAVGGHVEGERF